MNRETMNTKVGGGKATTTRYDIAEHLRTPEEMAAYFEACLEEANGDAAFIAKALGDIARAKGHVTSRSRCRAIP
jgi:probable addiction module antidote protein